jgi:glycyl-tRNA synthetase beta chain
MIASLLVELFTEELPPKALRRLSEAFAEGVAGSLAKAHLRNTQAGMRVFATPRRIAVLLKDVKDRAEDRAEARKLMPVKVAFDANGQPTAALIKRLEKEGASAQQVERRTEGNAEYAFLNQTIPGQTLAAALQSALLQTVENLPIPKVMAYQLADGTTTVSFVRPAHALMALHADQVLDVSLLGLRAGRITHGHRFLGVRNIEVAAADAYPEALAAHGKVMADFSERRAEIERQLRERSNTLGASLGPQDAVDALLEEVTALVEYPTVLVGEFEPVFLSVPQECLVLTMRTNQKYFPLFDAQGRLTHRFLIVSNMNPADPKNIVEGNQRVVRPRLADARFFYETDLKTRQEDRVPKLANIVYHNKLGSQLARTERVQAIARQLALLIDSDPARAARAAWLAKGDLVSNMVGEFPELQGTMGRYYALADGEYPGVAEAIEQHYQPRYAGDVLPKDKIAICVALADKLETLVGMFGIGQIPTGDKDPFALRRHALGIVRILIERELNIPLDELMSAAAAAFKSENIKHDKAAIVDFMIERLRGYLRDSGFTANEIEAVLAPGVSVLARIPRQLAAVRDFAKLPEASSLAAANKRVANILKQTQSMSADAPNKNLMTESAEIALTDALTRVSGVAAGHYDRGDYTAYLQSFAALKDPVDAFFNSVMVMAEDAGTRANRLALLRTLREAMNRIADLSKLAA